MEIDLDRLTQTLASRFGLELDSRVEEFDGGEFRVVRPRDLELGVGFCIAIARTHRQVEASFRPDNFAAGLLRRMGEADDSAKQTFDALVGQAKLGGSTIYVGVNDTASAGLLLAEGEWKKFDLDVTERLEPARLTPQYLFDRALTAASTCLSLAMALLPVVGQEDAVENAVRGLPEGAKARIEVNRYERSPANRAACILHYGPRCFVCGFDFGKHYGALGEGYIEVHHRVPVSEMGDAYFVDPVNDLIPVCGNCHSMLHRTKTTMPVEELQRLLREIQQEPY